MRDIAIESYRLSTNPATKSLCPSDRLSPTPTVQAHARDPMAKHNANMRTAFQLLQIAFPHRQPRAGNPQSQGWHFGIFGEGRFPGQSDKGYVRFSARKGAHGFRVMGHYVPAGEPAEPSPLEVEHAWYELHEDVGRRLHKHVEVITAQRHEYAVRCERQPHDEYIALRVPSSRRQAAATFPRAAEPAAPRPTAGG